MQPCSRDPLYRMVFSFVVISLAMRGNFSLCSTVRTLLVGTGSCFRRSAILIISEHFCFNLVFSAGFDV